MHGRYEVIACGPGPGWMPSDLASALAQCLPVLAAGLAQGKRWWAVSDAGRRIPVYGAPELERRIAASAPCRLSEKNRGAPAYELRLCCTTEGHEAVSMRLVSFAAPMAELALSVIIEGRAKRLVAPVGQVGDGGHAPQELLEILSRALGVQHGGVFCSRPREVVRGRKGPRVGWLTYLSKSFGPLPTIPPPTEVVPVDDLGWILVAQPGPVDEANADHQAKLAHVRHALGARVLRDGPAFPPPAAAGAVASVIALIEPDPAPAEVPSYMKGAPLVAALVSRPSPPVAAAPLARASSPLVGATVDIDLAKILKSSVPFDRTPAESLLPTAIGHAPQSPGPTFGETEEIDLAEILRGVPAVPFDEPAAVAPARSTPIEPSSTELPVAPQGKRWKRFDPQTGQPLTVPVLEKIPQAPGAAPSAAPTEGIGRPAAQPGATGSVAEKKPSVSTETMELDPQLLAAVLKKPLKPFQR